ncbi:MAG: TonB-dependent receptor [Candidatus Latescibacteria bacterium]|nr:TonB-dependent receptor [Candidatus Latescibacterota bacterium]
MDGFSQQDPLTGVSRTAINNNAIDQVNIFVGGGSAEYGRSMSGVVNVVTKEGGAKYSGTFEAITDRPTSQGWLKTPSFGYNNYDGALSGPLIPNNDRITFYLSGERREREDRSPKGNVTASSIDSLMAYGTEKYLRAEDYNQLKKGILPQNDLEGWTWQGKLNIKVSNNVNLKVGVLGSKNIWNTYSHHYRYGLDHTAHNRDYNQSAFARLTYSVNSKTFLTLAGNYFLTRRESGDGRYFNNLKGYGRPKGNPNFDREALYYLGDNLATQDSLALDVGNNFTWNAGDEGHVLREYLKTQSSYITPIKFDITSQVTPHHEMQAGFDVQRHTLRSFDHLFAYLDYRGPYVDANNRGGGADLDAYGYKFDWNNNRLEEVNSGADGAKHPSVAAFYVQDKIEYQGLVVNAGLRYDYLSAKTRTLKDTKAPLGGDSKLDDADLAGTKAYQKVSPRLGLGFPITDRTLFHANYGKFYQQPNLENLYVGDAYLEYKAPLGGYYQPFGNPNLKPEETTAYEVGFTRQFGQVASLDLTVYHKDTRNLVQVEAVPSNPAQFATFVNKDFGTVKGMDLTLIVRRTHRAQANLGYSLMFANGTGSNPESQRNIAWQFEPGLTEPPTVTAPLNFDQRHKVTINVDYRLGQKDGPALWGTHPLSNAGINVLFKAGSGFPYTPTFVYNEVTLASVSSRPSGPINSSYGPWTHQIDLKANKDVIAGQNRVSFYVTAINLLDRKNVAARDINSRGFESSVYSSTGQADETRWLTTEDGQKFLEQYGDTGRQK